MALKWKSNKLISDFFATLEFSSFLFSHSSMIIIFEDVFCHVSLCFGIFLPHRG